MKLQSLHESTQFSLKGIGAFASPESLEKIEAAFAKEFQGLKQTGDKSLDDKWEGIFTDNLSEIRVIVWKFANSKTYLSFQIDTKLEIVEFLNSDNDQSSNYFSLTASFEDEKDVVNYLTAAPKVLYSQVSRFAEWYFDMSGEHGKLKLVKSGDIVNGITFYAVGGKFETNLGANTQPEPKVY